MSGRDGGEAGPSSSGQGSNQQNKNSASLLEAMSLQLDHRQGKKKANKEKYPFWKTQPVVQFTEKGKVSVQHSPTLLLMDQGPCIQDRRQALHREDMAILDVLSESWCFLSCQDASDGPIDAPKTVQDIRQVPYALPER